MKNLRKWIAKKIYPEVFDYANGMKISLEECEQDLKTVAKEMILAGYVDGTYAKNREEAEEYF